MQEVLLTTQTLYIRYSRRYNLMDEINCQTAEQRFILMLQDRLDSLYDEVQDLKRQLTSAHFHHIKIKKTYEVKPRNIRHELDNVLNSVFKQRKVFLPKFAWWSWDHEDCLDANDDNVYEWDVNFYILTTEKISSEILKSYVSSETYEIDKCDTVEMYMFVKFLKYEVNGLHDDSTVEFWQYKGGINIDYGLFDFDWYDGLDKPFTESEQYNKHSNIQKSIIKSVLNDNILDLFDTYLW